MKPLLVFVSTIVCYLNIYAQDTETKMLLEMSLETLLQQKIGVSNPFSETLFNTNSNVTVIDRQFIDQYRFLKLSELLQAVAGVDISQTNLDANVVSIRGILQNFYANKVLILINGIPCWQPIYGSTSIDRVDIHDIERIEILKGPASILYGTNALCGAVNIILANEGTQGVSAQASYGYKDYGSGHVNFNDHYKATKVFVSANSSYEIRNKYEVQSQSTGLYHGDSLFYLQDEQRINTAQLVITHNEFSFFANPFVYSYNIPGVNYSIASGARGNFAQQGLLTGISFNKTVHEKFKLMSYFAYDYHQRDWAANDGAHDILYLKNERFQASFKANWRINESLSLDFGLEAEYGTGTHQQLNALKDTLLQLNMPKGKIIRNESVFAQFRYQLAKLELTAGSRIVHNNTFNKLQANRLSLLYKISARKSLKFVYGQAFRSPSMLELYFDHPTVVGNINLKPEFVNSYEIVFSATQGNFFGQLTGYYSKYSNLIQRISPQIDQPSEYINVGAINTVGIELEAKWQLPSNFSAFINYNLMQGTDAISDSNFNLIPDHTITAGIHKMLGKWSAGIYSYACSNTQGVFHNIAPQYFIDLNLDYSHKYRGGRITHALIVKNLTNSNMLIPQYIRASKNINEIPTMAYGIRAIYSLTFSI